MGALDNNSAGSTDIGSGFRSDDVQGFVPIAVGFLQLMGTSVRNLRTAARNHVPFEVRSMIPEAVRSVADQITKMGESTRRAVFGEALRGGTSSNNDRNFSPGANALGADNESASIRPPVGFCSDVSSQGVGGATEEVSNYTGGVDISHTTSNVQGFIPNTDEIQRFTGGMAKNLRTAARNHVPFEVRSMIPEAVRSAADRVTKMGENTKREEFEEVLASMSGNSNRNSLGADKGHHAYNVHASASARSSTSLSESEDQKVLWEDLYRHYYPKDLESNGECMAADGSGSSVSIGGEDFAKIYAYYHEKEVAKSEGYRTHSCCRSSPSTKMQEVRVAALEGQVEVAKEAMVWLRGKL